MVTKMKCQYRKCNKEITNATRKRKFCDNNNKCSTAERVLRIRETPPDEIKTCQNPECKKDFPVWFKLRNKERTKYCSQECGRTEKKGKKNYKLCSAREQEWENLPRYDDDKARALLAAIPNPTKFDDMFIKDPVIDGRGVYRSASV